MKTDWFTKVIREIKHPEAGASHIAIGAMLVMTILYASTMI